jgi:hypothetical protein
MRAPAPSAKPVSPARRSATVVRDPENSDEASSPEHTDSPLLREPAPARPVYALPEVTSAFETEEHSAPPSPKRVASLDDTAAQARAATRIQARWMSHRAQKQYAALKLNKQQLDKVCSEICLLAAV